jgi:PilZ domain
MALDYSEKRNYFRMNLDCSMEYSLSSSGIKQCGSVKNLSGDGISFVTGQAMTPGTEVYVSIKPENPITPPLDVTVEVIRCSGTDDNKYEIAGNITKR